VNLMQNSSLILFLTAVTILSRVPGGALGTYSEYRRHSVVA